MSRKRVETEQETSKERNKVFKSNNEILKIRVRAPYAQYLWRCWGFVFHLIEVRISRLIVLKACGPTTASAYKFLRTVSVAVVATASDSFYISKVLAFALWANTVRRLGKFWSCIVTLITTRKLWTPARHCLNTNTWSLVIGRAVRVADGRIDLLGDINPSKGS